MNLLPTLFGIILGVGVNALSDRLPTLEGRSYRVFYSRPRGWIVLAISIIAAILLWQWMGEGLPYYVALLLLLYLGPIAVVDFEYKIIVKKLLYVGIIVCGAVGISLRGIPSTFLGGVAGLGVLYSVQRLGTLFMRYIAKRQGGQFLGDALAQGDVYLAGVLGLLLGWPGIVSGLVAALIISGVAGILFFTVTLVRGSFKLLGEFAYAPYLIAGALVTLVLEMFA